MTGYLSTDFSPIQQRCQCGNIVRQAEHGCDYYEAKIHCSSCGKTVLCGPIVMVDRFSALEKIFSEHRIQDVPGYGMASLPHPPNFPVFDEEFDGGPFE